ncbi:hypothetical protein BKA69DRAFT_944452 [Paraphysoderma sedebokerense]|nr:hypothetical protein BKA69DRAFT_944452 [Paraphysoderma sedebokerense]
MTVASSTEPSKSECTILPILNYQCDIHSTQIICHPLLRLFRKCKNLPAVEITKEKQKAEFLEALGVYNENLEDHDRGFWRSLDRR